MKGKILYFMLYGAALVGFASCASILTKANQEVTFKGLPGTTVIDKKKNTTVTQVGNNGFSTVKMRKQLGKKELLIVKDGYEDESRVMGTRVHPAFWGNIILGGIPGMGVDAATGKMMKYKDKMVDVTLTKKSAQQNTGFAPLPSQEVVDRNNPGQTEMEKSVVRWYFDSDPRGARIFWRVISSNPDEVKNTNELYMTTTPLEETKSFNIPGLTYDNSQDVTIEIKVSKRGFEDQVKRYNVRQALDQQEISGFFELVPKSN